MSEVTSLKSKQPDSFRQAMAVLIVPIVAISITGIGLGATLPVISILFKTREWSSTLIGLNGTMGSIAIIIMPFFIAYLSKLVPPKILLIASNISGAIILVAIYYVPDVWFAFLVRLLFAFGTTTLFLLSEYWITAVAPENKRGMIFGIYGTCLAAGVATGPLIALKFSPQEPEIYWIMASIMICGVIPYLLSKSDIPRPRNAKVTLGKFMAIAAVGGVAILSGIIFAVLEYGLHSLLPVYGLDNNLTVETSTWLVVSFVIGTLVLQLPLGILADKIQKQLLIFILCFATAFAMVILPFVLHSVIGRTISLMLVGGFTGGLYIVGLALLATRFLGEGLINANAAFVTAYGIGALIGPAILGVSIDLLPLWGMPSAVAFMLIILGGYAMMSYLRAKTVPQNADGVS